MVVYSSSNSSTAELPAGRPRPLSKAEELGGAESQASMGAAGMGGEIAVLSYLSHPSLGVCFQHIWKSL